MLLFNVDKLSCLLMAASNNAPTAPTDAASVGVAKPTRIDPNTASMRMSGGSNALRIINKLGGCCGCSGAGITEGRSHAVIAR